MKASYEATLSGSDAVEVDVFPAVLTEPLAALAGADAPGFVVGAALGVLADCEEFPFVAPATGVCTILAQDLEPDLLDEAVVVFLDAIINQGSNVS
jgi:hypothetical protein